MRRLLSLLICSFIFTQGSGQIQKRAATYLLAEYNKTLHDYTIYNNPWGIGLGLQTFFNNRSLFRPTIELTGDIYLEDDKVLKLDPDGSVPKTDNRANSMVNLFGGVSFHPAQFIYCSLVAGPSFITGETLLGIKPSLGFYFSRTQKWTGKISWINVLNRTAVAKENFGSLSFAIGLHLF
jgi:hypothetical protein